MMRKIVSFLCLLAFLLVSCSAPARQSSTTPVASTGVVVTTPVVDAAASTPADASQPAAWPTKGWQSATPESQGIDPAPLAQLQARIKQKKLDLNSLLIIRNGYIVSENYYGGETAETLHKQFSVTKSFVSTLLGIAMDQGKLDSLDRKVSEALPGRTYAAPDPRKDAMTVENLLTMTSGLDWQEGDAAYSAMYRSQDWVKWVMDEPMVAEPGSKFNYCSGCTHVLATIVHEKAGVSVEEYARKNLFEPLGIQNLIWEKDSQGQAIGGWGLTITARDMAKLGYLFLHKGAWDGKQVISSSWVETATQKHVENPSWRLDYGYQWWIARDKNTYVALGRGGQMIYVDPRQNLIVVFTAGDVSHDVELDLIEQYILPAVK